MGSAIAKNDIIQRLQEQVLSMQGFKKSSIGVNPNTGLGPIEAAFPTKNFPTGAVHEFLSAALPDAAATDGFIAGLLGRIAPDGGVCIWISTKRTLFPPALKFFGVNPERFIFVDLQRQKDVLWVIEEALKCEAIAAVVGELQELSFIESRRLQLAVEQSKVTGFIHRRNPKTENPVACLTRWRIRSLPSILDEGLPGVGFPRWNVQLVKVRNGRPGSWELEWSAGEFHHIAEQAYSIPVIPKRKTG